MTRKLSLKRETLTQLSVDQLTVVVGGTHAGCAATNDCTHQFEIHNSVQYCDTLPNAQCLTVHGPRCIH